MHRPGYHWVSGEEASMPALLYVDTSFFGMVHEFHPLNPVIAREIFVPQMLISLLATMIMVRIPVMVSVTCAERLSKTTPLVRILYRPPKLNVPKPIVSST